MPAVELRDRGASPSQPGPASRTEPALRLTYLGGLCGAVFIVFKTYEWPTEVAQGHARGAAAVASAPITVAVILLDSSRDA